MNENLLNKATILFWVMFRLNMLFAVSNVVLIGALLNVPVHAITLPLYLIGVFLLVLSLLALCSTIRRLDELDKTSLLKLYIRCYKEEFAGSVLFAVGYIAAVFVLFSAFIMAQSVPMLIPVYSLLAVVLYVHFVFALLIRVNFYISNLGIWRLGMYCISKQLVCSVLILLTAIASGVLINIFPVLIFLGIVPWAMYVLVCFTKKMIDDLTIKLNIREEVSHESKNDN